MTSDVDEAAASGDRRGSGTAGSRVLLVVLVMAAAVAAAAGYLLTARGDAVPAVDGDSFQTVVLSNDRVYFGRLRGKEGEFYRLDDVYFVRETPGEQGGEPVREVLPLAAELQQPQDHLWVHESHLVLVQDLSATSEVLRTIEGLQRD